MSDYLNRMRNSQTLAAIDLGSNALRAIIARKKGRTIEVIRSFREPLRLGEDVFSTGKISPDKMQKTEEAFIRLFHLFTEYNVTDIRAMATSAMRDSKNGPLLADRIAHTTGIEIETISGNEEATVIFNAVRSQINLRRKNAILMDIGGGSTEIIIVRNEKLLDVQSFNVGTVRLMKLHQEELEQVINQQIENMLEFITRYFRLKEIDILVGTGGNLRRIGKIRKKILGRPSSQLATFEEVHHMEEAILSMSYVERIRRLELDQNRADVILPAIMLTHHLMKRLKMEKIILPKVGLKEGIILSMLPEMPKEMVLKD